MTNSSSIELRFLGGAEEVGRLGMLLKYRSTRFLFDYGIATFAMLGFLFWRVVVQVNRVQTAYSGMAHLEPYFWSLHGMIEETAAEDERWPGRNALPDGPFDIEVDSVSFGYADHLVLSDFSCRVPSGKLVAISGPSGSGKTTLVDLLLGLHRPHGGAIRIGGVCLHEIDLDQWRAAIGYVSQEPILISDTVRMNVTLGDPAKKDAVIQTALQEAGAWDFVRELDGKLDATVGEAGARLSAGQRQRLLLARALVRKPRLLILDEVTAALDSRSEEGIIATLLELRGRVSMVAVTPRPALVEAADETIHLGP